MLKSLTDKRIQLIIIVFLTTLAYINIFPNQYVADDRPFIVGWQETKNLENIPKFFLGETPPKDEPGDYRPVREVFLTLANRLWGVEPWGYHMASILIHLSSTVLVYLIVEALIKLIKADLTDSFHKWLPFLVSLLFGLHPIHTEAITYMFIAFNSIGAVFLFASFLFFLKARHIFPRYSLKYFLSVLFAALAFFTYEITLVIPFLFLLYEFCFAREIFSAKKAKDLVVIFGPYFILAAFYLVMRLQVAHLELSRGQFLAGSFYHTLILIPKIVVIYIGLLVFPLKLSFIHMIVPGYETYPTAYANFEGILGKGIFDLDILFSIAILLLIVAFAVYCFKRRPLVTFGIGWFFITLLPVSNVIPIGLAMGERFLYIPSFGFILILAYFVDSFYRYLLKKAASGVYVKTLTALSLAVILVFYGIRTYLRNFDWRNVGTFAASIIREYPESLIAHYNLGLFYMGNNQLAEAAEAYLKLVAIEPRFWEANWQLADIYAKAGQIDQSIDQSKKVLAANPNFLDAYLNLALAYESKGQFDLVTSELLKGLAIDPAGYKFLELAKSPAEISQGLSAAHNHLGMIYEKQNKLTLAAGRFSQAVYFDDKRSDFQNNLGTLLKKYPYLRSLSLTDRLGDGSVQYMSVGNYSLIYPGNWDGSESGNRLIINNEKNELKVEVWSDQKKANDSLDDYLKGETTTYGTLENEGPAYVPNVQAAYVRIWKRNADSAENNADLTDSAKSALDQQNQRVLMQFFLFKGDKVVKVLVWPADSPLMSTFDQILGTIRIN